MACSQEGCGFGEGGTPGSGGPGCRFLSAFSRRAGGKLSAQASTGIRV